MAALLCGLVPALDASRADVVSTLKDDVQGPSDRLRLRHAFVVAQVALSILLVVGAALFGRALQKAGSIDLGFDPRGVELTSLDLSLAGYTTTTGQLFMRELTERLRQLPGVQASTIAATSEPIGDGRRTGLLSAPGARPDGQSAVGADWNAIDPGYFATLQIPLVAGRDFSAADRGAAPDAAILGEAAERRLFPGRDAVGQTITLDPGRAIVPRGRIDRSRGDATWTLRVVGVARDIKYHGARDTARQLFVYVPLQQQPFGSRVTIVTRTTGGQRLAADIRGLIAKMDPNLPIVAAQTLDEWTAVGLVPQRVAASVSGALGLVGLLLAAIGIYGVTAYTVTRRTREIGIRVALGARRGDVVGMVLRQGLSLALAGSAIGLLFAAAAGRLLASFLLGVPAVDSTVFGGAVLLLIAIGLAACYVPACRAVDIDPIEALRDE
jgi:predicted permease